MGYRSIAARDDARMLCVGVPDTAAKAVFL